MPPILRLPGSDRPGIIRPAGHHAGFSMFELIVVLVVVGIMTAVAAPNLASFLANSRVTGATNDLIADLLQARSLGVTNGYRGVVCPSTTGTSCSTTSSDWGIGRMVFIDKNANGTFNTGDTLIKYTTGLPGNLSITLSGFPNTYITYGSYGGLFPPGTGTFTLCVGGATQSRLITINYSGHPIATRIAQAC